MVEINLWEIYYIIKTTNNERLRLNGKSERLRFKKGNYYWKKKHVRSGRYQETWCNKNWLKKDTETRKDTFRARLLKSPDIVPSSRCFVWINTHISFSYHVYRLSTTEFPRSWLVQLSDTGRNMQNRMCINNHGHRANLHTAASHVTAPYIVLWVYGKVDDRSTTSPLSLRQSQRRANLSMAPRRWKAMW
jgi:hypothetical protein